MTRLRPSLMMAAAAAFASWAACGSDSGVGAQDASDTGSVADALGDVAEADVAVEDTVVAMDTTAADTAGVDTVEADTVEADTSEADADEADTNEVDTTQVCTGPTTCDDEDPCTEDTVVSGSAATCDLVCDHRDVSGDEDLPDDGFVDSNCDGIDGTLADLVLVSKSGSGDGDCGTMDKPCGSIATGIARAAEAGKDVAVAVGVYGHLVEIADGVSVYGGYDPAAGWARTDEDTTEVSCPDGIGTYFCMRAAGVHTPTVVDRVDVHTPPFAGSVYPFGSTLGVLVSDAPALTLRNMDIRAADGIGGAVGNAGAQANAGSTGNPGVGRGGGGTGAETDCLGGISAPGGARGGNGGIDTIKGAIGTGSDGAPQPGTGVTACGLGGGAAGSNWNNIPFTDTPGTAGGVGPTCERSASRGLGAVGVVDPGVFSSPSAPWQSTLGNRGTRGVVGSPGAGGGGGGSGDADTVPGGGDGGGGGGGGGGGCGGWSGWGGFGGGASVAVLAFDSPGFAMVGCTLSAGSGGAGGAGGAGGLGGDGGAPGDAAGGAGSGGIAAHNGLPGGRGGAGAPGGRGGGGGGGQGGPSVALVLCRSSLAVDEGNTLSFSPPAPGGPGGYPDGADGADGFAAEILEGCEVPSPAVQLGRVRDDVGTLYNLPEDGTSPQDAAWDTCDPGYTLVGHDVHANGWWLCARDGYEDARYVVGNGDGSYDVTGLQRGNVTHFGTLARDTCPGNAVSLGQGGVDTDVAWVCVAPHTDVATRWDFLGEDEGWSFKDIAATPSDDQGLALTVEAGDPWLTSPSETYIDASYTKIYVRMAAEAGSKAQIFFMRDGEGPAEARSVSVPLNADNALHDYVFDMSQNAGWTGTIRALRFDPTDAGAGSIDLRSIRVGD